MFTPGCPQPDAERLASLRAALAARVEHTAREGPWRSGAMAELARAGFLAGFVPADCGGTGGAEPALIAALMGVAETCLTTALAVSQWASACRIIAGGPPAVRSARLPALARGEAMTTVGISQLTTSRRHLAGPALAATAAADGWRLTGLCPWVTGADSSDTIVTGAVDAAGEQRFFVVPTDATGLVIGPPLEMLALSGSRTTSVTFDGVAPADVIVPAADGGVRTGGLATTALALGAAAASLGILAAEAEERPVLRPVADDLDAERRSLATRLDEAARAGLEPADRDRLRAAATSLVVRAAQAALTASKGAGFVAGHPAERLARESLFFLVWSCPQSVSSAVLCELAGR
jgi:alkylation response protein AidB-like acyl-CoA dehydrogenase